MKMSTMLGREGYRQLHNAVTKPPQSKYEQKTIEKKKLASVDTNEYNILSAEVKEEIHDRLENDPVFYCRFHGIRFYNRKDAMEKFMGLNVSHARMEREKFGR